MRKDSTNLRMQKDSKRLQGSRKKVPVAAAVMVAGALMASTTSSAYAEEIADDSVESANPIIADANDAEGLTEYKDNALLKIEALYNKAILGIDSISEDPAISAAREKIERDFKDLQKRIIDSSTQKEVSLAVVDAQMLLDSKQAIPTVIDEIVSGSSSATEIDESIIRMRDEAETEIHEAIKDVDILLNSLSHISPSQYKSYRGEYTSDDAILALKSETTAEGIDHIKQTALEDIADCKTRIQARKAAVDDAVSRIESQYESSLNKINQLECITSDEGRDCRFVLRAKKDRAVFHIEHLTDDALGRAKEIADKYIETESNIYNPLFEISAMRSRYTDSFRDKTIACRDAMRELGEDERYQIEYGINELRKSCSNGYLELCQKKTEDESREVQEILFAELDQILADTVEHKELADKLDSEAEKVKTAIDKLTWLTKKDRVNRKAQIDTLHQNINFEVDNIELKDQIDGAINSMADCLKTAETLNSEKIEARKAVKLAVEDAESAIKTVEELSHIGETYISDLLFIERDAFDQIDEATTTDAVAGALATFRADYSQKLDEVKSVNHKYSEQKEKLNDFINSKLNRFRDQQFNYQGHHLDQADDVEAKKQKLQESKDILANTVNAAEKRAYSELVEALDLEDISLRGEAELNNLGKVEHELSILADRVNSLSTKDSEYHDVMAKFTALAEDETFNQLVGELNGYFGTAVNKLNKSEAEGVLDEMHADKIIESYERSCESLLQRAQIADIEKRDRLEALLRQRVREYLGEVEKEYQSFVDDIVLLNRTLSSGSEIMEDLDRQNAKARAKAKDNLHADIAEVISEFTKPGGSLYTTPIKEMSRKVDALESSLNRSVSAKYSVYEDELIKYGMQGYPNASYGYIQKQIKMKPRKGRGGYYNFKEMQACNRIDKLALSYFGETSEIESKIDDLCDLNADLPSLAVPTQWYGQFTSALDAYADEKKSNLDAFKYINSSVKNDVKSRIDAVVSEYRKYPDMIELTEVLELAKSDIDALYDMYASEERVASEHHQIASHALSESKKLIDNFAYLPQASKTNTLASIDAYKSDIESNLVVLNKEERNDFTMKTMGKVDALIDDAFALDNKVKDAKADLIREVARTKEEIKNLAALSEEERNDFLSKVAPYESLDNAFSTCLTELSVDEVHGIIVGELNEIIAKANAAASAKEDICSSFNQDVAEAQTILSGFSNLSEQYKQQVADEIDAIADAAKAKIAVLSKGEFIAEIESAKSSIQDVISRAHELDQKISAALDTMAQKKDVAASQIKELGNLPESDIHNILSSLDEVARTAADKVKKATSCEAVDQALNELEAKISEIVASATDKSNTNALIENLQNAKSAALGKVSGLANVSDGVKDVAKGDISALVDAVLTSKTDLTKEELAGKVDDAKHHIDEVVSRIEELNEKISSALDGSSQKKEGATEQINALHNLSSNEQKDAVDKLETLLDEAKNTIRNSNSIAAVDGAVSNLDQKIAEVITIAAELNDQKNSLLQELKDKANEAVNRVSGLTFATDSVQNKAKNDISDLVNGVVSNVATWSKEELSVQVEDAKASIEDVVSSIEILNEKISLTIDDLSQQRNKATVLIEGLKNLSVIDKNEGISVIEKIVDSAIADIKLADSIESITSIANDATSKVRSALDKIVASDGDEKAKVDILKDAAERAQGIISDLEYISDAAKDRAKIDIAEAVATVIKEVADISANDAQDKLIDSRNRVDDIMDNMIELNEKIKSAIDELEKVKDDSIGVIETLDTMPSAEKESVIKEIATAIDKAIEEFKTAVSSGEIDQKMQQVKDSIAHSVSGAEESNDSRKQAVLDVESTGTDVISAIANLEYLDEKTRVEQIASVEKIVEKAVVEIAICDMNAVAQKVQQAKELIAKVVDESMQLNEDAQRKIQQKEGEVTSVSSGLSDDKHGADQIMDVIKPNQKENAASTTHSSMVSHEIDSYDTSRENSADYTDVDITVALDTQFESLNGMRTTPVQSREDSSAGSNLDTSELVDDSSKHKNADGDVNSTTLEDKNEGLLEMTLYKVVFAALVAFMLLIIGKRRKKDK